MSIYKSEFTGSQIDYAVNEVINGNLNTALPIEVETESEMNEILLYGEIGGVYKFVGTSEHYITNGIYVLVKED